MTDVSEYALMAGAVYQSNKALVNLSPVPTGWVRGAATYTRDADTGFEADTFINFAKKEIVIGYAGTNFEFEKAVDFGWANVPLGVGLPSPQAAQAAVYYKNIEATYANLIGAGYTVSFTGHSLGGGLAALMAVWFDKPATAFDDAPFSASTTSTLVVGTVQAALQLQGYSDQSFDALATAIGSSSGSSIADPRRSNVTSVAVTGEVLSGIVSQYLRVNNNTTMLASDGTRLAGTDLHSIALLQAYELCGGLSAALQKNAGFLSYLMRSGQYGTSPLSTTPNVLAQLVKSQVQGSGGLNSLTNDLETLAAAPIGAAEKTLLRFAVADSYATQAQQGSFGQLFTEIGPGSTLVGVLDDTALTADNVVNGFKRGLIAIPETNVAALRAYMAGTDAVAAALVSALLDGTFSTAQDGQLSVAIPGQPKSLTGLPTSYLNDRLDYTLNWLQGGTTTRPDYLLKATGKVFFGSPPANTTATAGDDVVYCSVEGGTALGGSGADILYGLSGVDILDGGDGKDFLYGGAGDDWLGYTSADSPGSTETEQVGDSFNGGLGNDNISGTGSDDAYTFAAGDGQDTVHTQGGKDKLVTSGGYTYFERNGTDLLVKVGPIDGTNDFTRVADWFTPGTEKSQLWLVDANGVNYNRYALTSMALHVEGSDDADTFDGVSGYSDVINGNGGDDIVDVSASGEFKASDEVHGGAGNDYITAGNSNDFLYGDDGDDVITGGAGNDSLEGGQGDDALFGGDGASHLDAGDGYDYIRSTGHGSTLIGGADDDYIRDLGVGNNLNGGVGDDALRTAGSGATAHGEAGSDFLWNEGNSNVLYGDAGDDYIEDSGSGSVFGWKSGDGMDYIGEAGNGSTFRFDDSGSLQATRQGTDLVVQTGSGEGATFYGWFTGQSRMNVEAPDGTVWTPAQIDSHFSTAAYNVSYSSGVYDGSAFVGVMASFIPSISYNFENVAVSWSSSTSAYDIAAKWQYVVNYGQSHLDETGRAYWSSSMTVSTTAGAMESPMPGGGIGTESVSGSATVNFDIWQTTSGDYKFAITGGSWGASHSLEWVSGAPSYAYDNTWYESLGYGNIAHSERHATQLTPQVDAFTLYTPGSVNASALQATLAASEDYALVHTADIATADFGFDAAVAPATSGAKSGGLTDWWSSADETTLSHWRAAAERGGESLVLPGVTAAALETGLEAEKQTRIFAANIFVPANDFMLFQRGNQAA